MLRQLWEQPPLLSIHSSTSGEEQKVRGTDEAGLEAMQKGLKRRLDTLKSEKKLDGE